MVEGRGGSKNSVNTASFRFMSTDYGVLRWDLTVSKKKEDYNRITPPPKQKNVVKLDATFKNFRHLSLPVQSQSCRRSAAHSELQRR